MKIHYLPIFAALLCLASTSLPERELPRRGKDFALFIAVNNYQNWDKLQHPISEVEKIAGELYRQYDFDTLVLRNPAQDQIITALKQYNAKTYPNDGQLLIYLSGHGAFDELTKEGFFIPEEGRLNDPAQTSYLSFNRLKALVENIPCRHILLAIDACYSGTFDKLVAMRGTPNFGRPGGGADKRNSFIENQLTLDSRYFVASGKKELTPDASNFALHFLHALRNGDGEDHILTIDELVAELKNTKPTPHISTFEGHQEGSNFLFIKNITTSSSLQKLEIDMVPISGGAFIMGALNKKDNGFNEPKPSREVLMRDFFIGKYEVSQAQWRVVMGSDPPMLYNKNCDECPVEGVSWEDTQDFIDKLNTLTNKRYRLPSEAEWEYAARGGNQSQGYLYSGNNNLFRVAWYNHNYEQDNKYGTQNTTHPVGQKKPNELGLYDMSGNVWEWVEDCWHNDYTGAPVDGSAWINGAVEIARVNRGGGWSYSAEACTSTTRNLGLVSEKRNYIGFRLAL